MTDQDIAKGVESLLRHSDPNSITTVNGVVQQLEAKLGLDLSHKASFIRDQIDHLLRSLTLRDCSSAVSFPGGRLPESLKSLSIKDLKKLEFPMQHKHELLETLTIESSCD